MGSFSYTVSTAAEPAAVLDYLADLRHLPEFIREIDDVRQNGDRWDVVFGRPMGMPDMVLDYSVTSDAGSVVAEGTHPDVEYTDTWEVAAAPGGSEVHYRGTYTLKGGTAIGAAINQVAGSWRARGIAKKLAARLDALADGD